MQSAEWDQTYYAQYQTEFQTYYKDHYYLHENALSHDCTQNSTSSVIKLFINHTTKAQQFKTQLNDITTIDLKVNQYLDSLLYSVNENDLDILKYWKLQVMIFSALIAMIKNVLTISIADVEVEWLFNLAQDVITYWRDWLNEVIIKIIMMIKFNLLQH